MQEPSNINRWNLIMHLSTMAIAEGNLEVQRWCQLSQSMVLRSLRRMSPNELDWLMILISTGGGGFLSISIYPQLLAQWPLGVEFWPSFLRRLYQNSKQIAFSEPTAVSTVISQSVEIIVDRLAAFPRRTIGACGGDEPDMKAIIDVIRLCLDVGQPAACASIALRMRAAADAGDYDPRYQPWNTSARR